MGIWSGPAAALVRVVVLVVLVGCAGWGVMRRDLVIVSLLLFRWGIGVYHFGGGGSVERLRIMVEES